MSIKIILDGFLQGKHVSIHDLDEDLLKRAILYDYPAYSLPRNFFKFSACIKKWDFDAFLYDEDELLSISLACFVELGLLKRLNISTAEMSMLLSCVRCLYIPNAYHNYRHAVDVLQSTYYILSSSTIIHTFTDVELFSLLLASYCHDIRHPGCSNQFLSASGSKLAQTYENLSILEKYHFDQLSALLHGEGNVKVLPSLSEQMIDEIIKLMYEFIISTDLIHHMSFVKKLSLLAETKAGPLSLESSAVRIMIGCCLIKFSDISNVTRPFSIYLKWLDSLVQEIELQCNVEDILNFPHHQFDVSNLAKFQCVFMDNIALPFFKLLTDLLQGGLCSIFSIFMSNRGHWNGVESQSQQLKFPSNY